MKVSAVTNELTAMKVSAVTNELTTITHFIFHVLISTSFNNYTATG
jgi:hypothetical protein